MATFVKVPRVFLLAGFILIFLFLSTNRFYYNDENAYPLPPPIDHSTPNERVAAHAAATTPEESKKIIVEKPFAAGGYGGGSGSPIVASEPATGATSADSAAVVEGVGAPGASTTPGPQKQQQDINNNNAHNQHQSPAAALGPCEDLKLLRSVHSQQQLTEKVRYQRICLEPIFSADVDRHAITSLPTSLFGSEATVNINECESAQVPECTRVQLKVPEPYDKHHDVSHLVFGVATDYQRLQESIDAFAHWLSRPGGRGAKLVALLVDYSSYKDVEIEALLEEFRDADINVQLVRPLRETYTVSHSHFTVLAQMLESNPEAQWYGLLDDDTFFPRGLKPLSDALAKLDHTQDQYVGALSEDFEAVRTFGFMAFGGAGVYLSAPLAKTLGNHIHECISGATMAEGDIIIRDCVYSNSKAKLTTLPGLFQQDMKDDASGFFESGVEAINFHHWKSWFNAPVVDMAAAALYCGDCFLQRWQFEDDTIFTNGYSIVKYLYDVRNIDLNQMEGTWTNAGRSFDFSIGPLRRKLVRDEKKSYTLKAADFADGGNLHQLYVWDGNPATGEADGVIEVVWQKRR
ncbi:hypothetical protein PFICI_02094 [Pestalotiopsis fici W106-1]|uniref:Glycosyltransferase family 31 protein n=1 Tax=Pestalotiopsis fici (strain W106-1 / CGMCC3.15140) TaxID=1229662 RepID=W3XST9_PESFW|nr:uncharacterized protein PFICI_02094 [Pestalotiopsis fici W106-1]ETS88266.1 hypothetical protein PFICI_02094 [Pestalotiopsis fici W106-1]